MNAEEIRGKDSCQVIGSPGTHFLSIGIGGRIYGLYDYMETDGICSLINSVQRTNIPRTSYRWWLYCTSFLSFFSFLFLVKAVLNTLKSKIHMYILVTGKRVSDGLGISSDNEQKRRHQGVIRISILGVVQA